MLTLVRPDRLWGETQELLNSIQHRLRESKEYYLKLQGDIKAAGCKYYKLEIRQDFCGQQSYAYEKCQWIINNHK